ncbi:MAG: hypothetical protein H5T86_04505 [Armatimonadetes bacterium]|nr:hypothetical protein [Armatimonadota bacterium]
MEGIRPDLPPSVDVYTNCYTTIPLAPDHHLLFPTVYLRDRDLGVGYMAASRDGKLWHFLPGSPVVTPGPPGRWDAGWKVPSPNLVELPNGDFALPCSAQPTPHKYPRGQLSIRTGYALWPKGRIVALEAPERGEFTTKPLAVDARRLRINAVTQRAGSILLEVAGVPGRSFADCDPIIGDHYRKSVTCKGQEDLGVSKETPVVLRFRLDKAKIFGLDFE